MLEAVPTEDELARLYYELARIGARASGDRAPWRYGRPSKEELVVLACEASRYDPRLLWVAVSFLTQKYDGLNPLVLRRVNDRARWPAALAVAFEFARRVRPEPELRDVAEFVVRRVSRARDELFFIGTRKPGGKMIERIASESLAEYRRWGYLGSEVPIAKELGSTVRGTMAWAQRRNVLLRLGRRGAFSPTDYMNAIDRCVSRRQAARDLSAADFLVREGNTRAIRYRLAEPRPTPPVPPPRRRAAGRSA